jgi:recombinational DNA repair ATPase RecF
MKGTEAIKLLEQLSGSEEGVRPQFDANIMITVLSHLTEILSQETAYLKKRQVSKVKTLQEEKERLISILEILKANLSKSPAAIAELSKETKSSLRNMIVLFETVMQENHLELLKTTAINQKVVEAVTEAIQDKLKEQLSYTPKADKGMHSTMPPIAFSEEI